MKMRNILLVVAAVALASTSMLAKPPVIPKNKGTSILHFFVRKAMVNDGVMTNAVGRVDAKRNQQGKADNQRLEIAVGQLEPSATYQLLALLGDDTNYTQIAPLTTDTNGNAVVRYMRVGSSKNPKAGVGRGKTALPDELNPISDIRALAVANSSTQAVLTADLTAPDKLQYLIKRWMDADPAYTNVAASLQLSATTSAVRMKLRGYGLEPSQSYLLAVNGAVVDTAMAKTNGRLDFISLPVSPSDILLVRELAIWGSTSNNILSTRLP